MIPKGTVVGTTRKMVFYGFDAGFHSFKEEYHRLDAKTGCGGNYCSCGLGLEGEKCERTALNFDLKPSLARVLLVASHYSKEVLQMYKSLQPQLRQFITVVVW